MSIIDSMVFSLNISFLSLLYEATCRKFFGMMYEITPSGQASSKALYMAAINKLLPDSFTLFRNGRSGVSMVMSLLIGT